VSNASEDFPEPDRPVINDELVTREVDGDVLEIVVRAPRIFIC